MEKLNKSEAATTMPGEQTQTTPAFAQGIDAERPHTLLTDKSTWSGSLLYRYDDTQEEVTVPNIWYNQPYQIRVAAVRWEAERMDHRAMQFEKSPPYGMSEADAEDMVRRYRNLAQRIRAEASRMEAAGRSSHPVAASRMQLDYGPVV